MLNSVLKKMVEVSSLHSLKPEEAEAMGTTTPGWRVVSGRGRCWGGHIPAANPSAPGLFYFF